MLFENVHYKAAAARIATVIIIIILNCDFFHMTWSYFLTLALGIEKKIFRKSTQPHKTYLDMDKPKKGFSPRAGYKKKEELEMDSYEWFSVHTHMRYPWNYMTETMLLIHYSKHLMFGQPNMHLNYGTLDPIDFLNLDLSCP